MQQRSWCWKLSLLCASAVVLTGSAQILPPGHRPIPPDAHALTHGQIATEPGKWITNGVILIRRGRIEGVGANLPIPADARVWDLRGALVYPGFIEPYLPQAGSTGAINTGNAQPFDQAGGLTAGGGLRFFGVPGDEKDPGTQGVGYELATVTPEHRVADKFTPELKTFEELRELGFTTACVVPDKGILRGQSAVVELGEGNPNDLLLRADAFQHIAFDVESGKENAYPKSLMGVIAAWRQAFFDAEHYAADQTDYLAHPNSRPRPALNPALAALQPAATKQQRVVIEPGGVLMLDRAARIATELNLDFTLVASGQEWRRPDLMKAIGGTFIVPVAFPSPPKFANDEDWQQISLDQLRAWDWSAENPALLRQNGIEIALTTHGLGDRSDFRKNLRRALDRGLSEDDALAALTTIPARHCNLSDQLGSIAVGKLANLVIVDGTSYFNPDSRVREVWIEGRPYPAKGEPPAIVSKETEKKATAKTEKLRDLDKQRIARSPLAGRGVLADPSAVLVEGVTIWTCGPAGRIENGSLLVANGKVQYVGRESVDVSKIEGKPTRISGVGLHLTPGLIDAHNHSMIMGGVNENTLPSTAMVRIGDVINSEASTIYQQLAGGLTVANELHGSANPIGGQNSIIKLRDAASPEGLKLERAPLGIKFALGENVKQSNWGEKNITRFPQTRMGVRAFYANRFTAARQYLEEWAKFKTTGGLPPRRDLELETLGEILEGKRWIHCHSYRQDEILAFLRLMEDFGIRVGTLQHVLEGYKVADEIARHGAGGSCFSDWWAYKFEVYDAIPYAGSLMHQRGVVVSFNSDSSDLARRLNLEAAKAVKYGGTSEEDALKFVTLNPAKQLRIESRVGSLESGKDGDFVLWSKSPLDSTSHCLQTWIEGKKYFDRQLDTQRTSALAAERSSLIEKAKKIANSGDAPIPSEAARAAFFRQALESARHLDVLHCQDCQLPRSAP